jgi:capsular exopolysaccharide synthesis family protein
MEERQIKYQIYLTVIWQWLWLILLISTLVGIGTYTFYRLQKPIYEATSTLLIDEAPGSRTGTDYNSILTSERLAQTYAQMMVADTVLTKVLRATSPDGQTTPDPQAVASLKRSVNIQVVRNTQLVRVAVRDTDPVVAAARANAIVTVFSEDIQAFQTQRYADSKDNLKRQIAAFEEQIKTAEDAIASTTDAQERGKLELSLSQNRLSYGNLLQTFEQIRLAEAQNNSNVTPIEPATVPQDHVWPRVLQNTGLGVFLGLLTSIALVVLFETLDTTMKDPDGLSRQVNLPLLAMISSVPELRKLDKKGVQLPVVVQQPRSPASENFRKMRTNIEYASIDQQVKTLLVTSPYPADGKSTIALNIAAVIAQSGKRVILVDADMRRPSLHSRIGAPNRLGLSSLFVQHDLSYESALQPGMTDRVQLLSSGPQPPNPAELLGSTRMAEILQELGQLADVVIIDAPPMMPVTDAAVLSKQVDGVMVVVRAGKTKTSAVVQIVEQLRRGNAHILGLVINDITVRRVRGYGYYYNRKYYDRYNPAKNNQPATESGNVQVLT